MLNKDSELLWKEYFYPGTDVLINNFKIKDYDKLKEAESTYSFERLLELRQNKIDMDIDKDRLNYIHQYLYEDIYPFAGKYRKVNINKTTKSVLDIDKQEDIEVNIEKLFKKTNALLKHCNSKIDLCEILANLYTSLTYIHPYIKGNSLSIREFIREYSIKKSEEIGMGKMELDWSLIDKEELSSCFKQSDPITNITSIFLNALIPIEKVKTR